LPDERTPPPPPPPSGFSSMFLPCFWAISGLVVEHPPFSPKFGEVNFPNPFSLPFFQVPSIRKFPLDPGRFSLLFFDHYRIRSTAAVRFLNAVPQSCFFFLPLLVLPFFVAGLRSTRGYFAGFRSIPDVVRVGFDPTQDPSQLFGLPGGGEASHTLVL